MAGHAVFEHVVGVGFKAFDLGAPMPQRCNLDGDGVVVGGVAQITASGIGLEQALSANCINGVNEEREILKA
jgi:hypothetical protein